MVALIYTALRLSLKGIYLFLKLFVSGFNEFLTKNGPFMAAAISFNTLLSIIPLGIAVIAIFAGSLGSASVLETINTTFASYLPIFDSEAGKSFLDSLVGSLQDHRFLTSTISIFFAFVAALGMFSSIRRGVNSIAGTVRTRNYFIERLMDFSLLFGAIILLVGSLFSTFASTFLDSIVQFFAQEATTTFETSFIFDWVPYVLSFLVFFILYWWLPNAKIPLRAAVPMAVIGTVAFEFLKYFFILFGTANNFSSIYGGFASIMLFLIFVYISAIVMLVGAMLTSRLAFNIEIWDRRKMNKKLSVSLERVRTNKKIVGVGAIQPVGGALSLQKKSFRP